MVWVEVCVGRRVCVVLALLEVLALVVHVQQLPRACVGPLVIMIDDDV